MAQALHLLSPKGFRAAGVYAGIKSKNTPDVALLICDRLATAAAAFTQNQVVSPAVIVGQRHIKSGKLRGNVVNAGNANACTGKQGERDALRMCELAASIAKCKPEQILPSSTGIIGHPLPMKKLERGIIEAGQYLGSSLEHAYLFADAILTTDLKRKTAATRFQVGQRTVTLAGVCKGSGMIGPRLAVGERRGAKTAKHATMLAYLTTDADIAAPILRSSLSAAVDRSFNAVTVDNHSSTNDTCCVLASGVSEARIAAGKSSRIFADALREVCESLARQIAADGEGATKLVTIAVRRCKSESIARTIARAIADSPLVKCAMHGNDPNWGRIVSAAGLTPAPFNADRCTLTLAGTKVFRAGVPVNFDPAAVSRKLAADEVLVDLDCGAGNAEATVWTCDLSKEYVTINADYHT